MMELMEGKNTKEEKRIPKNIRQMGEPGPGIKALIEDYAYTYLHQLAEANLTCMKTAVLVGRIEDEGIYVQGALEIDMGQEVKQWFSNEHWRDIFQMIQKWFEGLEVVGWFLANPGFPPVLTEELKNLHNRNFSGKQYIFFQMDVLERDEVVYTKGESGLTPLCGYYIYYEKNDRMQAYMSQQKGGAGIEPEGIARDRAAARFRNVMQEKKEQNAQKKAMTFLYASCTFLVMVILVIGVTLINNYDRMANMENAIHHISESLEEPSELSVEEAMEQENQQAAVLGQDMSEEASNNKEESEKNPAAEEKEEETDEAVTEEPVKETSEEQTEEVQEVISQAVREPEKYRVQTGDTLLEICRARYGDEKMVKQVCEMNDLEDGDMIYVGEIILLP